MSSLIESAQVRARCGSRLVIADVRHLDPLSRAEVVRYWPNPPPCPLSVDARYEAVYAPKTEA